MLTWSHAYLFIYFKKKRKNEEKKEEEEANLGLMIAPKFFESQKQNFCHVIKPLTCFPSINALMIVTE